ncbi:hypothetical protein BDK92_2671 [Micromonospora pisi]|uniref:Uncharacterized protein n=1 Tax=Micromonospora pisi TaxID=589240 RepID=A0A495JHX3_9ACTN|nr:hypothetical protein BDK92_2671 [Micromonospora pisi]
MEGGAERVRGYLFRPTPVAGVSVEWVSWPRR